MRSILIAIFLIPVIAFAQTQPFTCTTPGQTPSTAFPVCGTKVFTQLTVPLCGGATLPSLNCPSGRGLISDINPFFYKFTCFQTGTLGFLITPKDLGDDYDWELYDVTGVDPNTIYSNGNLVVGCNWSGEVGLTGSSSAGTNLFVCEGMGQALFSKMPTVQAGHNYLLLVSHFTNTQSGYTLEFKGGTGVITDTNAPHLAKAIANCGGDIIRVKLNKKIKCTSLAADGSDFFLTPANAAPQSSVGFECSIKFDTDSIEIKLNGFLPPGNYSLGVKPGTDGNTLLDYCDNPMPITDVSSFTVLPNAPTPLDSMAKLLCAPTSLQLILSKPILCSSIAADGSDFMINGTYPVSVSSANGVCSSGLTNAITVTFSQALQRAGNFTIQVRKGSDGNTIYNECGTETPVGASLGFMVKDTVNADFTYNIQYDCTTDVVEFFHPGGNGVNTWSWNLDDAQRSNQQNPQGRYTQFGTKNIQLAVSNGFCADSSSVSITLDNVLKADFSVNPDNCPLEPVIFTANSIGKITRHDWSFGDGGLASGASPTHVFERPPRETTYNVRYTVTDSFGC
ncbi:MAG TPA: PKD domain-containing protein, partial [Chitinophagaceae bacterium]|nr:PKD domain-containing protein [Chitinophagaceae bacterium]